MQFDVDLQMVPPMCLPTGLDRGQLLDITRLADQWRRYIDKETGALHDGAVYAEQMAG